MKLPPKLKLGPHVWTFGWHEGKQKINDELTEECCGLTSPDHLKITFEKALKKKPATYQAEVVVHEVQHAINSVYGVTDDSTEEAVAEACGRGWLQLIVDHPEFIQYVQELVKPKP